MKIAIVLSTYNGEKYISEQLDSILNQTYQDFIKGPDKIYFYERKISQVNS